MYLLQSQVERRNHYLYNDKWKKNTPQVFCSRSLKLANIIRHYFLSNFIKHEFKDRYNNFCICFVCVELLIICLLTNEWLHARQQNIICLNLGQTFTKWILQQEHGQGCKTLIEYFRSFNFFHLNGPFFEFKRTFKLLCCIENV